MKLIAALCLVAFVDCESISENVPNSVRLIKKRMSPMDDMKGTRVTRIINGQDGDVRNFPWQASLWIYRRGRLQHLCGAAVVSTRAAITAAHCFGHSWNPHNYKLQVGTTTLSGKKGTFVQVDNIIKHPNYTKSHGEVVNDIAILKFDKDIAGMSEKSVVAIPKDNTNDFSGLTCTIGGWGRENAKAKSPADHLQTASTVVLSQAVCKKSGYSWITPKQVCVLTEFNGPCYGDSGSALTCGELLVGVTSFGKKGCLVRYPSVYTRISAFLDWIHEHID